MIKQILLTLTFSIAITQGCTNRSAYKNMQARNEVECRKLPSSEYDDCIRALDKDYDSYREQREEVIRNSY